MVRREEREGSIGSKPTPKPSASMPWDPSAAARTQASTTMNTYTPISPWSVAGGITTSSATNRTNSAATQTSSDRWVFNPAVDGISATDSTIGNEVISNVALLGDYGNRNNPWLNSAGNLNVSADAAAAWVKKNNNTDAIAKARSLLIAKGWISADAAKLYSGNGSDPILMDALSNAVTSISYTNFNRMTSGMDLLTLEEGLDFLMQAPTTSSGGGYGSGGTRVQITRQEFKPEDYRLAVDKAYKEITGQGADEYTLNTYIKVLQKLEEEDPMKQVQKTSGNTTTVKQTGGVSQEEAQDVLLKKALAEPETADYQKATTFMDYFNEAIKAKVDL